MTEASPPAGVGAAPLTVSLVTQLTRGQIVQYAGASGDFNPLHTDEIYATEVAGFPSVFAHGMLTMAMTGRALTDLYGLRSLRRFGGRFRRQVWPGDSLSAVITVTSTTNDGAAAELSVTTINQHGAAVFEGTATILKTRDNASFFAGETTDA